MKKSMIAVMALSLSFFAGATERQSGLNETGEQAYKECVAIADGIEMFLNKDFKDLYVRDCYSLAGSTGAAEETKKKIISTITTEEFNIKDVISLNEYDFIYKMGLISSFLIESPNEKLALIKYIEGDAKNHSVEERQKMFDKLDIMFKDFKINSVFYKNLKSAQRVLNQDYQRIKDLKDEEISNLEILTQRFQVDENNSDEKKQRAVDLVEGVKEQKSEALASVDFYLDNFNKYMSSSSSANLVYRVFNVKNPLFLNPNKLPKYTKSECSVLKDWKLTNLFEEKHHLPSGYICKK